MPFIDTHVHLHFPEYDADRGAVIARAEDAGIEAFINVGTDVESTQKSLELAKAHENIFAAAGIHPHDAKKATLERMKEMEKLVKDSKVVAIGEVGLDFFRDHSPREKQREVLLQFFEIYRKNQKPLILHCRDAYEDLIELLKRELRAPLRGVLHCFSSDKEVMKRLVDLGFYISFAGPLTYKKNQGLREACQACPLDRLLLETDAPFLPPQSVRGQRNESAFLLETAKVAAELQGVTLEKLGERTSENARKVFGIPPHPSPSPPGGEEKGEGDGK